MENRTKKIFPIQSDTACLLKWSWSTIFLGIGTTSSCHRCNHDQLTVETFKDFHNTPNKIQARQLMREGVWPQKGCQYCEKIEAAGGVSDRQYQIDSDHDADRVPTELLQDPTANVVTPRTLEIYFSNTCNLKCIYCSPQFSSQIKQENIKFGPFSKNNVSIPVIAVPQSTVEYFNKFLH